VASARSARVQGSLGRLGCFVRGSRLVEVATQLLEVPLFEVPL